MKKSLHPSPLVNALPKQRAVAQKASPKANAVIVSTVIRPRRSDPFRPYAGALHRDPALNKVLAPGTANIDSMGPRERLCIQAGGCVTHHPMFRKQSRVNRETRV